MSQALKICVDIINMNDNSQRYSAPDCTQFACKENYTRQFQEICAQGTSSLFPQLNFYVFKLQSLINTQCACDQVSIRYTELLTGKTNL